MAEDARMLLQEAFLKLDTAQRAARQYVAQYQTVLPERSRTSGLVPRHRALDQATDALMVEYLHVLDAHAPTPKMGADAASVALQAFRQLEPRLARTAGDLEQFLLDYDVEFQRVGREMVQHERDRDAARAALAKAVLACENLRAQGFESRLVDDELTRARTAARAALDWRPEKGLEELRTATTRVTVHAEEAGRRAEQFPELVRRAQRRAPSLQTRVDAILTRAARLAEDLGALRREFSEGNWADLHASEEQVDEALHHARGLLSRLRSALADKRWDEALVELERAEAALARADSAVDEPRNRLRTLREVKADPKPTLDRAAFAIRDARMMVLRRAGGPTSVHAMQLDAMTVRVETLRRTLQGVHPDYLAVLNEVQRVQDEVRALVLLWRTPAR